VTVEVTIHRDAIHPGPGLVLADLLLERGRDAGLGHLDRGIKGLQRDAESPGQRL
jgi:hypothetical protein